jgi:hypothetical protein
LSAADSEKERRKCRGREREVRGESACEGRKRGRNKTNPQGRSFSRLLKSDRWEEEREASVQEVRRAKARRDEVERGRRKGGRVGKAIGESLQVCREKGVSQGTGGEEGRKKEGRT